MQLYARTAMPARLFAGQDSRQEKQQNSEEKKKSIPSLPIGQNINKGTYRCAKQEEIRDQGVPDTCICQVDPETCARGAATYDPSPSRHALTGCPARAKEITLLFKSSPSTGRHATT